jgi:plasmid stability protein
MDTPILIERFPKTLRTLLKIRAIHEGKTLRELVIELLRFALSHENERGQ